MDLSKKFGRSAGFTKLELVLVVVIIGTFAVIALPHVVRARDRGQIGAAQYELSSIRHALAEYAVDRDCYPPSIASYEDFRHLMANAYDRPSMNLPSGKSFRWISYSTNHRDNYLLIVQALDHRGTKIKVTADTIQIER
jgi:type II secretory pathway pseudopilin PulG